MQDYTDNALESHAAPLKLCVEHRPSIHSRQTNDADSERESREGTKTFI
jgi:hypothetical protein